MDKIKLQPENGRMRRDQLLTIDDLETFKQELFVELRRMFGANKGQEYQSLFLLQNKLI